MKRLVILALGLFALLIAATPSSAEVVCQPIYGGGQTCVEVGKVSVDKKVKHPQTETFLDGLNINDPRFSPSQDITFRITVTNATDSDIAKIVVKDTFPQHMTFVSGPGSFDANTRVLTFDVENLAARKSQTFTIVGRIADIKQIPASQDIFCVVNQATASVNGQTATDNAQFCIESKPAPTAVPTKASVTKGGLPVVTSVPMEETPATGPEMIGLAALLPAGVTGWFLRRKAK